MAVTLQPLIEGRVLLVNYTAQVTLADVQTVITNVLVHIQKQGNPVHTLNSFTDFDNFAPDLAQLNQRLSPLASHPLYRWSMLYGLSRQRVHLATIYNIYGFRVRVCQTAMQAVDFLYRIDESLGDPPLSTNLHSTSA